VHAWSLRAQPQTKLQGAAGEQRSIMRMVFQCDRFSLAMEIDPVMAHHIALSDGSDGVRGQCTTR